tara:strand:+ start:627 stop:839 length:213 start_codon:yes stop_codon:yes gene_type:complete
MNSEFDTIDLIVEKMFDILEYICMNYYTYNVKKRDVNIELGNLYTIEEEEEEEEIENDYIIVQIYNKSYI